MEDSSQTALMRAVQANDAAAFDFLVAPYQREILVHCYRMLGSFQDAEDLVQETLVRAWEKRATLTNAAAFRAWLYRIATNLCLNTLERRPRRSLPSETHPHSDPTGPVRERVREPIWLEPFPDHLFADPQSEPESRALRREYIALAFIVTLQHLTPAQRAILLLREVLGWEARTVAEWLNLSVAAVNSSLQRARRVLRQRQSDDDASPTLDQPHLQALLDRYVALWEQADIPGFVALLREDAWFTMPPLPIWYQGRAAIAAMLAARIFTPGRERRLVPSHANGAPAFGIYQREAGADSFHLLGLMVVDVADGQIGNVIAFMDPARLAPFALPPRLSIEDASA